MFDIFNVKKEGPGVYKDTPRKKGIMRFFEVVMRDFSSFWLAGFISTLAYIPGVFLVSFAIFASNIFWALIFGFVGGMIGAPFFAGTFDTILRSLRDEPGYFWIRYRKAFKNNWKASLIPGGLFGVLLTMQIFTFFVMLPANQDVWFIATIILSLIATLFIFMWLFTQLPLFDMNLLSLFRNSALLAFSKLPRTLGGVFFLSLYWAAVALFFPLSVFVVLVTNFWLPILCFLCFIYPALDKQFGLEEKMNAKREAEYAATKREQLENK